MPKFEIELTFYRTVEAANVEDAADVADYEKSRLVDNGLAGDLGWEETVTKVKRKKEN